MTLVLVIAVTLTGCGGGDPLPAGGPTRGGEPSSPPSSDVSRALTLSGVSVVPPYDLRVRVVEVTAAGPRYRVTVDALDWRVEFDVETWRVAGGVVGTPLTSAADVPNGGLVLGALSVNGAQLGTTGTTALDGCDPEDDGWRKTGSNRQGIVSGRFARLDAVADGTFAVAGTDDRCRRLDGEIAFVTPVE